MTDPYDSGKPKALDSRYFAAVKHISEDMDTLGMADSLVSDLVNDFETMSVTEFDDRVDTIRSCYDSVGEDRSQLFDFLGHLRTSVCGKVEVRSTFSRSKSAVVCMYSADTCMH